MKKIMKIVLPLVLVLAIIASIGWYLFVYDRDFTRDMLLQQARRLDARGNGELASWFYDLAYEHSDQDQSVAIELANQYKADGNYTKAEYTLTNAIADSATIELYIALCDTYLEQDKVLDAIQLLDNIGNPTLKAQLDNLRPAAPASDPEPGFYSQYIPVNLTSESGSIYYTITDDYPSLASDKFTEPFTLTIGETVVRAVVVGDNGLVSPIVTYTYTVGGVVEKVNFTDPAIESALRAELGVDEDYEVYTNELWEISEFTVPAEAASFEDLTYLPYLKKLTAEDIKFPSLGFLPSLEHLEELHLTDCKLPEDALSLIVALPKLQKLTLADCGLSTIADLEGNLKLTYLDLSNNTLRHLEPISQMFTLKEVHLQHNALSDLSALSGLVNLEKLDVSYNSLAAISHISACTKLSWLNIANNAITDLTGLEGLAALSYLDAESNELSNVSVLGNCTALVELNLSSNTIADISALATLSKLEILDFSYNQVAVLPAWPEGSALYSINGSYNSLTSLDNLKHMAHLAYVYMDYNQITDISALASCHHLVMVNVYGNTIEDVSALTDQSIIVNYDPTV